MSIFFLGFSLAAFQVTCHGAPERLIPVPQRPANAFREEKYVEKRVLCTDNQLNRSPDCASWAASGYCEGEHFEFMNENCYASCGNCEAPPTPAPTDEVNEYACLQAHNDKRALHQNTPDLVWDDALAQHAKDWADHLAATGQLNHDPKLQTYGEGENLYHAFAQTVKSCSRAVEIWYSEEKNYNYITGSGSGSGSVIGHFTQVVWKGTTHLGVAKTKVDRGNGYIDTYIVARYSPRGNTSGQYTENVKEKKPGA